MPREPNNHPTTLLHRVVPVGLLLVLAILFACGSRSCPAAEATTITTLEETKERLALETAEAYRDSPYSFLSKDYFARFSRDPDARPVDGEVFVGPNWRIVISADAQPLTETMAGHLAEFLCQRLETELPVEKSAPDDQEGGVEAAIVLLDSSGGDASVPESFTISATRKKVMIQGRDPEGLRDGVVKLVDMMGCREAPIVPIGEQVYRPRLGVRLGVVPWMGSYRDLVFMGHNAVLLNTYFEGEESLFAVSRSKAMPELVGRRKPEVLQALVESARQAKRYGLKVYAQVNTRKKFANGHAVFAKHPEARGALTWKADGEYVLCTEHRLVRQYLTESVEGLFEAAPLDGLLFINGGESFYHCFMRSHGTAKGHTNCERCERLGAETVVANLSNNLLAAARRVNPRAEIIAWPYSAEHVWSADLYQIGVIEKLDPGAGIFTEIEKGETIAKPDGVRKYIGDYSIDFIGPSERSRRQVAACKRVGVPIYVKSEPELGFEAPGLPYIPCLDRWAARAEVLASCGANGAWVLPYFRPNFASASSEVFKYFWWDPMPEKEEILLRLAGRIAGKEAGPHLRDAWKHVSDAVDWSPEQPSYYKGPYYLGPTHPMCVSPDAELPRVFFGQFLFMGEMTDKEGLIFRPTFVTSPTGNVPVFGKFYRQMESCLRLAVDELDEAVATVPQRNRLTFEAASSPIRWFYHTARTQANFYESCQLRDALNQFAEKDTRSDEEIAAHRKHFERWKQVLLDEKANTENALPLVKKDMRLDCYYGMDHSFPHAADMIRTKLELLNTEIERVLPDIARRGGLL